jgi:hypothetical protein
VPKKSLRERMEEPATDEETDEAETSDEEIVAETGVEAQEEAEIEAEAPQEKKAPKAGTIADYKDSLQWVVTKLQHPSEQWGMCDAHGKVPFTHECATYHNDEFAKAMALAEMDDE